MKVLLLAPDYTHAKSWTQEHFRQEIGRQHEVIRSTGAGDTHVPNLVAEHTPDVVIVCNLQFSVEYTGMDQVKCPTIAVITDYFPRHHKYKNKILQRHAFDVVFFSQTQFVNSFHMFKQKGRVPEKTIPFWLPFSIDPSVYHADVKAERPWDVTFCATDHPFEYPNRKRVAEILNKCEGNNFVRLVENDGGLERPVGAVMHGQYADLLKKSKICVTSNDLHGCVNIKHLEFAAAGALVVTDVPRDFARMGFIEGVHYVAYDRPEELPDLLRHWLGEYRERFEIAQNGQEMVGQLHANDVRVETLTAQIVASCGGKVHA